MYLESKKQNKNLVEILSRLQEKNLSSVNVETLQKVYSYSYMLHFVRSTLQKLLLLLLLLLLISFTLAII